jgi:hypothetical protein
LDVIPRKGSEEKIINRKPSDGVIRISLGSLFQQPAIMQSRNNCSTAIRNQNGSILIKSHCELEDEPKFDTLIKQNEAFNHAFTINESITHAKKKYLKRIANNYAQRNSKELESNDTTLEGF